MAKVENTKNNKATTKKKVDSILERANKAKENQEKPKIKLAELVNTTIDFVRGTIGLDEMSAFGEKLSVRTYMPMMEKLKSMMVLIYNMNMEPTESQEVMVLKLEKDLFFEVLLGGYGMIDVNDEELKTYTNYDLLYPIFAPYILQFCETDYNHLVHMIDKSLDIYHMRELTDVLNSVDYKEIERATEENKKFLETLEKDRELVKNLKQILAVTNPATKALTDAISKQAIEDVNNKLAQEGKEPLTIEEMNLPDEVTKAEN